MKKIVSALVVVALTATDSYACHRGLLSRIQERRDARHQSYQSAPQSCAPAPQAPVTPLVAPPPPTAPKTDSAVPVASPLTVIGNGNCVNGNCSGPATIQRGGLLFRRR